MKYKCLGPFKFEGKTYRFGDVVYSNTELNMPGVLVFVDNTNKETPEIEVKEEKKVEKKPVSKPKKGK